MIEMEKSTRSTPIQSADVRATELLLASIPSILIGVGPDGRITHWNAVAESMFGLPAASMIHRPFAECEIRWDKQMVLDGITECRRKGSSVRLPDIEFSNSNGEKKVLGFTLIPVRQNHEDFVECILFGADITERKRIEQLKNEFVSTVSHELRTPLTVIKETVSQVMEELLGPVNEEQKRFLGISLESIDRLGRIVNDLLDISKIEAGRLELKREMVDVVALAKGLVVPFNSRARLKGLEITTHFPPGGAPVYVDEDRIIQVFTNLIDNAIKFTDKGRIEVSVVDRGNVVECSVKDAGLGISSADLPKVFGKFQQLHPSSGQKGTGLGLAICKGIVDAHKGQIGVESRTGEGTTFTFTLPRHTAKELFQHLMENAIKEASKEESSVSFIAFEIGNIDVLLQRMEPKEAVLLFRDLEKLIKAHLPPKAEAAVRDNRAILVVLPAMAKEQALIVAGRIQQTLDNYFSKRKMAKQIGFACKVVTFPEDGNTEKELLEKVGGI